MKIGLVIGKFMPIHIGHIALINFALLECDNVIVSMSIANNDPINPDLRLRWIKEIFKGSSKISIHSVRDDFDREELPWSERIKIWAQFVKTKFPSVNVIISSEEYGPLLSQQLGITHASFDPQRIQFPVSASMIRKQPLHYWEFIPTEVRPYFVKKLCFFGPESTGKSTLAKKIAGFYNTESVPEVAREIVTSNDFTMDDIVKIGHAQIQRTLEKTKTANKVLFCDTDLITTQIYCRHYLKDVPPVLFELEKQIKYNLYFLFEPDVPWVADGLRDLGERRMEMFEVFKMELDKRNIHYIPVKGNWQEREATIKSEVNKFLI
ncbi:MAG: multifunctional transcriptional regulator/nicotinamide-nucleotide adenylyltransferase/ribosylnicotinamide kinase NadR [Bacteroidota bacterium]